MAHWPGATRPDVFSYGHHGEKFEPLLEGSGTALKTRMGNEAVSGPFPKQFLPTRDAREQNINLFPAFHILIV